VSKARALSKQATRFVCVMLAGVVLRAASLWVCATTNHVLMEFVFLFWEFLPVSVTLGGLALIAPACAIVVTMEHASIRLVSVKLAGLVQHAAFQATTSACAPRRT